MYYSNCVNDKLPTHTAQLADNSYNVIVASVVDNESHTHSLVPCPRARGTLSDQFNYTRKVEKPGIANHMHDVTSRTMRTYYCAT